MNNISFDYSIKESLSFNKNNKVIIMFHGYGSNKDDLFSFAKFMNPDFLIISIQAPIQMDYNSYCWWSLNLNNAMQLQMDDKEAKSSLNELNRFISEDLSIKYNFGLNQVYLLGFSQGCMISYALSINFPENYKKVVGLSKLARTVEVFAKRLQTQERLNMQIAKTLMSGLEAKGVAVTIDASHQCMTMRGIKKEKAMTLTNYFLGTFKEDLSLQNRYLKHIGK